LLLRIGHRSEGGGFFPDGAARRANLLLCNIFGAVRRKIAISLVQGSIIKVARKLLHVEGPHQTAGLKSPPKG
jgi:hypothetical protein